jgi:hypothetical protein
MHFTLQQMHQESCTSTYHCACGRSGERHARHSPVRRSCKVVCCSINTIRPDAHAVRAPLPRPVTNDLGGSMRAPSKKNRVPCVDVRLQQFAKTMACARSKHVHTPFYFSPAMSVINFTMSQHAFCSKRQLLFKKCAAKSLQSEQCQSRTDMPVQSPQSRNEVMRYCPSCSRSVELFSRAALMALCSASVSSATPSPTAP